MSSVLFEPCHIGGLKLSNRFVRSATWDATADESGKVTDRSVELYRLLGQGRIGLVVSGFAFVSAHGQAMYGQYGVHSNDMIPGLSRLVKAVHEGGGKIALQVVHAGINSSYLKQKGLPLPAVSEIPDTRRAHREMTDEEIYGIIEDFAAAAVRCREAGFDAIQLHGAHGYLMSQFISPLYNHRSDWWGGSTENRRRFHLEIVRSVRQSVGSDYPFFIKFGVMDDRQGGLSLDDGVETACQIVTAGIDAIEVSGGIGPGVYRIRANSPLKTPFRERAAIVKKAVAVPVILVGGIRSLEMAEHIINSGDADMISMCRPFIREPYLIARWERGETDRTSCITCSRCMANILRNRPLECEEERRLREQADTD